MYLLQILHEKFLGFHFLVVCLNLSRPPIFFQLFDSTSQNICLWGGGGEGGSRKYIKGDAHNSYIKIKGQPIVKMDTF